MTIRIAYMSDVHIEFERPNPARPTREFMDLYKARKREPGHPERGPWLGDLRRQPLDFAVLAGDIDTKNRSVAYADQVAKYLEVPVVLIEGNHESGYGGGPTVSDTPRQLRSLAEKTDGRVTFLECETKRFDLPAGRVHVLGTELWTDFELFGGSGADIEESMLAARRDMNDYRFEFAQNKPFTPEISKDLHRAARNWLASEIQSIRAREGENALILVVTHMAPLRRAVPLRFSAARTSAAYASDMSQFIEKHQPDGWIFGHCHRGAFGPFTAQIGRTQIRSATRGYVGERTEEPYASGFRPQILEIGELL